MLLNPIHFKVNFTQASKWIYE